MGQKKQASHDLAETVRKLKEAIDTASENKKIYDEVIQERKRFLMSSYLMKEQEDLEMIL